MLPRIVTHRLFRPFVENELAAIAAGSQLIVAHPGATDVMSDDLVVLHTQYSTQWDALGHAGALFDVPWFPLFLFVAFLLHFWIGVLATVASAILFFVAWRNQRATAETMQTAHWGARGFWWRWHEGPVETTAFALQALVTIDPENRLVARGPAISRLPFRVLDGLPHTTAQIGQL